MYVWKILDGIEKSQQTKGEMTSKRKQTRVDFLNAQTSGIKDLYVTAQTLGG